MPLPDDASWSERLRETLERYREPLLRSVAARLLRPRNQWPAEELIERALGTIGNAPVIDRRLQEMDPAGRQALALIGHSRQPRWRLGNLIEMLVALGHPDGLRPVLALLEAGLLYPVLAPAAGSLGSFEEWLGQASGTDLKVFAHPAVALRAVGEDLGLPRFEPTAVPGSATPRESDGEEWPLRLAVLWQQVAAAPIRRTQQGDFFKRDLERLRQDPILSGPPADHLVELPDSALLAVALAEVEGILVSQDGEWRAGSLPAVWDQGLAPALQAHFASLPELHSWNAQMGGVFAEERVGNPFPSAYLLALLLLASQDPAAWIRPADVEAWLMAHHPYWASEDARPSARAAWVHAFLLGLAHGLKLVQAVRDDAGDWALRLSPFGRWLLGRAAAPPPEAAFPQTLFVQPNLEIVAYRQGLNPGLIGRLTRFADWKGLGAACTLQLSPESVYRALETGLSFRDILQTLERHGMRPTPGPVVDSLRTWADKRERISVYASASLLEFASPDDLTAAVNRGLPAVRLSDRLALVAGEDEIEFKHFRLTGTRDYGLPPEKCVTVEPDGVSLTVDMAKSDLLLETELPRFAERADRPAADGRRHFRLTPASLAAGRESGLTLNTLESWFQQRAGEPLSPAARLLLTASQAAPVTFRQYLVLVLPSEELADGVEQWPETASLILERLGPTTLAVTEENAVVLRQKLLQLGWPTVDA